LQGDRIFIPRIDVDERFDGARILGAWVVDHGSTLLVLLEILDAITLGLPSAGPTWHFARLFAKSLVAREGATGTATIS
jgi:hypothetical protein